MSQPTQPPSKERVGETEVDCLAQMMIGHHGADAGRAAAQRVNDSIDAGDGHGRDVWARVVQAIHHRCRNSRDAGGRDLVVAGQSRPEPAFNLP
ncbi:MAG: hypothetical protein JO267_08625 [Alphaproteobacteria bacterium]|nr:hypothetical protein [Alphaproteobacteria bacterium]